MLKAIEIEFKTKKFLINKWVVLINRYVCEFVIKILEKGLQKVYAMKVKGNNQQNFLQLIMTILDCYKGGYNAVRKTVVRHCMNLISAEGLVFSKTEMAEIIAWNETLDEISSWEGTVRKATRCRFLYWYREYFPVFFQLIASDRHRLNQMNYFLMAVKDPVEMLTNIRHLNSEHVAVDNYKKDVYEAFTESVVRPICQATEE
jgi:hypothetical protein